MGRHIGEARGFQVPHLIARDHHGDRTGDLVAVDLLLKSRSDARELGWLRPQRVGQKGGAEQGDDGSPSADSNHAREHSRASRAPSIATRLEPNPNHRSASHPSAPCRPETGAGNDSRVWIRGWLRKIPLSGMAGRSPRPGLGSAGPDLRAQGSSKAERLSRGARGMRLIASSACSGPVPLPPGLPELANWPPITPRSSPQAGNPKYPPASILGRERCFTDGVCQNRKSFPAPPSPSSGFLREALPDLHEKFSATGRVAPLLAC